ncbi:hypothetical protein KP509_20G064300 [Ceratopteris richardii]|nr:hypothetical protein KP509_20G064300 [Ceratopteris richardii]
MLLIGAGYWIQGFRCFPWFIVSFYLKDAVGIDPGTLQIIQNTVNLPMVAKPVYGIISDTVYIRGAHRVPYLVIGGVLQALSWATIAFLPGNGSSISVITVLLALSNLGASIVDVANDAMVAECAKKSKNTGELQSFAWLATAVGGVLGNLIAACALQCTDFRGIFGIFGMLLAFQAGHTMGVDEGFLGLRSADSIDVDIESRFKVVEMQPVEHISNNSIISKREPYVFAFEESPNMWRPSIDRSNTYYPIPRTMRSDALVVQQNPKHVGMRQHFIELFNLVKRPEILGPVSWFMSSYALIPTLAGSMFFFQTQQLNIDPSVVGMAKVMGQIGLVGGSMVYTRYLKGVPLRKLLGSLQVLLSFCMLFDILLVKRMNVGVGIPDAVMVMGASAFVDAINQFKMLPFMVLLAQLCPVGSEGSLLAAFMSLQCLSTIISGYMGVTLTSMLHITCNDYSELPTGIMLESTAALLPLLWISLIPEKAARSSNEFHRGHGK